MTNPVAPSAPSLRQVHREPNRRRLRRGLICAGAAFALMIVGIVLSEARGALVLADPVARAERDAPMTFEASPQIYEIIVAPADPVLGFQDREVTSTRCTVMLADGSTSEIRGDRQMVRRETSFGTSAGTFRAVSGPTTVTCDNNGGSSLLPRFLIAPRSSPIIWFSWGLIGAAVIAAAMAAWLIRTGIRGRVVIVDPGPERP